MAAQTASGVYHFSTGKFVYALLFAVYFIEERNKVILFAIYLIQGISEPTVLI